MPKPNQYVERHVEEMLHESKTRIFWRVEEMLCEYQNKTFFLEKQQKTAVSVDRHSNAEPFALYEYNIQCSVIMRSTRELIPVELEYDPDPHSVQEEAPART
jgi:hypothetical protein